MGMMKWVARKGAVGGTARWAAKEYLMLVRQDPNKDLADIFKSMITQRYIYMPAPDKEAFLLGIVGQIRGLRGLVVSVLTVEAGFTENTQENKEMFMDIIVEELTKLGVPEKVVMG